MIVVDKSKQAALYSDEWSADLDPDFARVGAGEFIDMAIRAIGAITGDPTAMEGGKSLFGVMTHIAQRRASAANVR